MPDTTFAAHAARVAAERAAKHAQALQGIAEKLAEPGPNIPLPELRRLLHRIGWGIVPLDVLETAEGAFETWIEDAESTAAADQFETALSAIKEARNV